MTKAEYETYLRSEHWHETRLAAVERAEGRCQLCNTTKRLHVHHRTYIRLGCEAPGDLTVLCESCHHHFHFGDGAKKKHSPAKNPKRVDWPAVEKAIQDALSGRADGLSVKELAAITGLPPHHLGQRAAKMRRKGRLLKRGSRFRLRTGAPQSNRAMRAPGRSSTQARRARIRKVACPRCGAGPGERCQNADKTQEKNHAERLEAEYRARRQHSRV